MPAPRKALNRQARKENPQRTQRNNSSLPTAPPLAPRPSCVSPPRRVKFESGCTPLGVSMSSPIIAIKFGAATAAIFLLLGYLAYTGVQDTKSYYVTIQELHKMGDGAYAKRLRVAGNVQPGSIKRKGTHVEFVLVEGDQT